MALLILLTLRNASLLIRASRYHAAAFDTSVRRTWWSNRNARLVFSTGDVRGVRMETE
jgi:hypothetical protein